MGNSLLEVLFSSGIVKISLNIFEFMLAYSLDLSLGLVLSPTPDFGSICHEKPMGARSGDFGNILVML